MVASPRPSPVELLAALGPLPVAALVASSDADALDVAEHELRIVIDDRGVATLGEPPPHLTNARRRRVAAALRVPDESGLDQLAPDELIGLAGALARAGVHLPVVARRAVRAQLVSGAVGGAIADARAGLKVDPDDRELATLLAIGLEAEGRHGAAASVAAPGLIDPAWFGRWAMNLFVSTGRRVTAPTALPDDDRNEWIANRAWIETLDGDIGAVAASVREVLDDPGSSPQAVVWVCVVGAVSSALDGLGDVSRRLIGHARSIVHGDVAPLTPFAELQIELAAVLAQTRLGEHHDAMVLADRATAAAPSSYLRATWLSFGALARRETGRFDEAAAMLTESLGHFAGDPFGLVAWARSELAVCQAMTGHPVDQIDDVDAGPTVPGLFRSCVHRNRAWILAATGDVDRAIDEIDAALAVATERGQNAHSILALVDLARFGEPRRAAAALAGLTDVRSPLIRIGADAVLALASDDRGRMTNAAAAARLAGMSVLAVDLLQRAHDVACRSSDHAAAARLELAIGLVPPRTPISRERRDGARFITQREHEVVALAARGLSSRDIASTLAVSVRTVDNLLGRVYAKCDVTGRRQLAEISAAAESGHTLST